MTDIDISKPLPLRSVSQINQYTRCPMAYKLSRIDRVWSRPAAWLPQGSAFHEVAEWYEKNIAEGESPSLEQCLEMFKREYAKYIGVYAADTPNFDFWSWSGPYNGERDIERRWEIGLEQVEKFFYWRNTEGQSIWVTPDGKPAIELSFNIELDGILVRGFIDAVVLVGGVPRVRDYKTGNSPGDDFQLGVYALAIRKLYPGVEVWTGDYFMAGKKGKKPGPTAPYDLSEWTEERVSEIFREVEERIKVEDFEPLPEPDKCKFCDVSFSCEFSA